MSDQAPKPPKKPEPRKFSRQMIVEFVDLMMLSDQIVAEYRKRKEDDGESTNFIEELGFNDRVQLASVLMGHQMREAITDDVETRKAAFEHMKALEKIRLAEEGGAQAPTQESPQVVRLEPEKIEKGFAQLAENHGVPNARARQFVKLLMTTPEGHQMLQLMLYDVVQQHRGQNKGG